MPKRRVTTAAQRTAARRNLMKARAARQKRRHTRKADALSKRSVALLGGGPNRRAQLLNRRASAHRIAAMGFAPRGKRQRKARRLYKIGDTAFARVGRPYVVGFPRGR